MSKRPAAACGAAALLCLAALPTAACAPPTSPAGDQSPPTAVTPAAPTAGTPAGDQARFLAGLPVAAGSPLHALTQTPEWRDHQQAMDLAWPKLEERLAKAAAFQATRLGPLLPGERNVIYFFGGPDAAHAVRLFPGAPAYLLAGLERVGAVQAPESMRPGEWHAAIDGLASALRTFVEKSFFVTSEMGHDLAGRGIMGVQPVLYLFLARSGAEVLDATYFEVDAAGVARDKGAGEKWGQGVPGVRIRFQVAGRAIQAMSYVRVDLSDDNLARQPGFLAWAKGFAPANGFLKAASFILHDRAFSRPRALLLEACEAILQDDSGVPYGVYRKSGWELTCFGKYLRPRKPFEKQEQEDLAQACAGQAGPLDFVIGYRRPSDSALQLYVKRPGATVPPISPPAATTAAAPATSPPPAPAEAETPAPAAAASPLAANDGAEPAAAAIPSASPLTPSVAPPALSRGAPDPTPTSTATPAQTATSTPPPTPIATPTPAPAPATAPATAAPVP